MNATLDPTAAKPSEDAIREYAYRLYLQNGCVPGHDLQNWLEAEAALAGRGADASVGSAQEPHNHLRARRIRARRKSSNASLPEAKHLAV